VNKVNVGERYKNITFTTYAHETKELVNVVNVARGFLRRRARSMPIGSAGCWHELDELA